MAARTSDFVERMLALPETERRRLLRSMPPEVRREIPYSYRLWARPDQLWTPGPEIWTVFSAGRGFVLVLGILVLLAVLFVVGNTIRLAVAGRREEIEVMKLCGADDGFVRGPFLVEGTVQGFAAALLSILILTAGFVSVRAELDGTLGALAGIQTTFLPPLLALLVLVAGALAGALGSALSLRRYLTV